MSTEATTDNTTESTSPSVAELIATGQSFWQLGSYGGTLFDSGDRCIDQGVVETIMGDPKKYGNHQNRASWSGSVVYREGKFIEEIRDKGKIIEYIFADTPEELFHKVTEKYGWE